MPFMVGCFEAAPDHRHLQFPGSLGHVIVQQLDAEAEAMCGCVGKRTNKPWIWMAMALQTRQSIALHVGNRSRKSAAQRWAKRPWAYRAPATFSADRSEAYKGVMPTAQHNAMTTLARKTTPIARVNNTVRQRVSRLVRDTFAFSKKLANHLGAITFVVGEDNLTRAAAALG